MRVETKQEVIELIRNNRECFARFGVSEVGLFGSFVREEQTEESDVDLLVNLSDRSLENFCNLLDFSESLFERSVDIISENSITPINGRVICREVEYVYANAESFPAVRCIRSRASRSPTTNCGECRCLRERLIHIFEEAKVLIEISQRVDSADELYKDMFLCRSAERSIEICGEAVKALPKSFLEEHDSLPWSEIARTRDNVIHRYFSVDPDRVWEIVTRDAPILKREISKMLEVIDREEYGEYRKVCSEYPTDDSSFLTRIEANASRSSRPKDGRSAANAAAEKLDIAIAKKILAEYPAKFQNVAIAKIKDILCVGERATEMRSRRENTSIDDYIKGILQGVLGDNDMRGKDLSKGAKRE